MGQRIWGVLADYEGRWVAVDNEGKVIANDATLPGVMNAIGEDARGLTIVFAAAETAASV